MLKIARNLLEIPPTNLKTHGPRSFSVATPTLWNAVLQSIRSTMKIETFKSELKTYLYEKHLGQNYVPCGLVATMSKSLTLDLWRLRNA